MPSLIHLPHQAGIHRLPEASPDLRAMGFGAATTDNLTAPASSHLDTLTKVTLIVLARTRVFTSNRTIIEKAVTSVGGFAIRLTTTNALQLRWWRTTNTSYGYNNVVALNRWQWFVAVGDANAGAGLKWRLFTAPIDRLVREAARTATTEGSGALASTAANALTIGNAKTATTLAYQGDIALVAVFGDQLSLSEIHRFQMDPRPGMYGGFPCLGFWRPGHRGQTDVMDETFRAGAAVRSGGVAVSGGVQFWDLPLISGRAPAGTSHDLQASGSGVATGSATLNVTERLQATGTGVATGSALLNVTERLQASGSGVATGSALLNVTERLQATGTGVATGTALLNVTERLQATGSGVATGTALLNVTERLQATGSGVATGSAALTITAGTSHNLQATGTGAATGSALLNVTERLQATGSGAATGTALLNVTKRLLGTGTGAATGSGVLRAERRLQAIGGATAGGSAALTRIVALSASGAGVGVGVAGLYVERRLQATGNGAAFGTGRLYSEAPVSTQTSRYELQRTLSLGALTGLRSGFERERNLALDSIKRG